MLRQINSAALLVALFIFTLSSANAAGSFPSFSSNGIMPNQVGGWSQSVTSYNPAPGVIGMDAFGGGPHNDSDRALGRSNGTTVSLGELGAAAIAAGDSPGSITVEFFGYAFDAPGPDLAIFENAFAFAPPSIGKDFTTAELAFVEVSTNGTDFARFAATSLNEQEPADPSDTTVDQLYAPFGRSFASANTTNIHNLAGVHPTGTGTPFDLAELASDALVLSGDVDLQNIRFVRLVDIPGDGSTLDSQSNPIFDAWETELTGGLDLDAVGAIHFVPEPSTFLLLAATFCVLLGKSPRMRML